MFSFVFLALSFKTFAPFLPAAGALFGPIGAAIGTAAAGAVGARQAKKARKKQDRAQKAATQRQEQALERERKRVAQRERETGIEESNLRRSLLGRRGRKRTLFGSPLGVEDASDSLLQRLG